MKACQDNCNELIQECLISYFAMQENLIRQISCLSIQVQADENNAATDKTHDGFLTKLYSSLATKVFAYLYSFTHEEEEQMMELVERVGKHWSVIAQDMGRSQFQIKDKWYSMQNRSVAGEYLVRSLYFLLIS